MALNASYFLKFLQPGDVLLYRSTSFFGWIIRHASNSERTHSATYIGDGKVAECVEGTGVHTTEFKDKNLVQVLRPLGGEVDLTEALKWHAAVYGAKYDWTGLLRSFGFNKWGIVNKRFWCSEHSTEFARRMKVGGQPFRPFPDALPADKIAPGDFEESIAYETKWLKEGY